MKSIKSSQMLSRGSLSVTQKHTSVIQSHTWIRLSPQDGRRGFLLSSLALLSTLPVLPMPPLLISPGEAKATAVPRQSASLAEALAKDPETRKALTIPCPPTQIDLSLTPNKDDYDLEDKQLRQAAADLELTLQAPTVTEEEEGWTAMINIYSKLDDRNWRNDLLGRAYGNRGNARARQGKMSSALHDYNTSIELCPWSVDPVLNRGVALESLGRFEEAERDYMSVLKAAPNDPAAYNNLGNVRMAIGRYDLAVEALQKAASLSGPADFAFASANLALALYQLGRTNESIKMMRGLLRRYPDFIDMRAALAASLWGEGLEGQAESEWARVEDPRYKDIEWLTFTRRWPPLLVKNMEAFTTLRSLE